VVVVVEGILHDVHLGHQDGGEAAGQRYGERRDQPAFDKAVADALRRRRPFGIGDQSQGGSVALVAEQVPLEAREDVAEADRGGRCAGADGHRPDAVVGREINLEVDVVQQAELEGWIAHHPGRDVGVGRRGVVVAVDEDVAFVLEVPGVDCVGHVRLGRPVGVEGAHLVDGRRIEEGVLVLLAGTRVRCRHDQSRRQSRRCP